MGFLDLSFNMEGLQATLRECERRGLNMDAPMRQFGREKRKAILEILLSGKGLAPLAASTLRVYARQDAGDKKYTLRGTARATHLAQLEREQKRLQGLKSWAERNYGKRYMLFGSRIPSSVQKKLDRFDAKLKRIETQLSARQDHPLFTAGQVGADERLAGGPTVELKVVQEGSRRRVRVTTPGYRSDVNVAFPRHLRKPGSTFQIPASALTQTTSGHYRVKPTAVVRTSSGLNAGAGRERRILGQVPQTIFFKVVRHGRSFSLVVGSRWAKDGIHNAGDSHTPQRLHVFLTSDDPNRLAQILVSYGIQPLRQGARR